MTKYPLGREDNIVVQELKDEVLIYDLNTHKAFCLNKTSALVWQLCDGTKSADQISNQISRKSKTPVTEELIWLALDELKKNNLLANAQEISSDFNGMNRREVIRKIGLTSLVALPIISSLIAPTAAMAQSATAIATCTQVGGVSCNTAANCPPRSGETAFCNTTTHCCVYIAGPAIPGGGGIGGGGCPNGQVIC